MKVSPQWLREFAELKADDRALADALTLAGIAVESISGNIFEMEITTNRVDAMNHYGIAREASAIYDVALKPLAAKLPAAAGKGRVTITNEAPEACARFTGQEIRNVKIGPSKGEVPRRFAELEQKPINNAADATNYVMLMMGKPTHAFDLDKLAGGRIVVRQARAGESLKTLDGVERKLHAEDVVVADAEKAVAIAGVIGGWGTMITEATRNIFIESAWWEPASIRRTARRHGIHTDASHRFERGADWASCPVSCDLVAEIILASGGELAGEKLDAIARTVGHKPIALRLEEVARILGKEIPAAEIERILTRLGFRLKPGSGAGVYTAEIPTWRLDVEREIDVIEEIARIHGYNRFRNTLPSFSGGVVESPEAAKQAKVRSTLLALGYNETLSSTFMAREESQKFSPDEVVAIANPLSEEAAAMRTSLVPGMLEMMGRNLNRGIRKVRLFELGHIFALHKSAGGQGAAATIVHQECPSLCFAATVSALDPDGRAEAAESAFRSLKGDVETVLGLFSGEASFGSTSADIAFWQPGLSAEAKLSRDTLIGTPVARFGMVHSEVAAARKLKADVYLAEVFVDRLFESELSSARYAKLSRFPAVERDFSFVFSFGVTYQQVQQAVKALKIPELRQLEPVEVFRGGQIAAGKYSMLLRVVFQSQERTLRDEEVAGWTEQIAGSLTRLGGQQRA